MASAKSADKRGRIDADFFAHPQTDRLNAIEEDPRSIPLAALCSTKTSGFTPKVESLRDGEIDFATIDCISPLNLHKNNFKRIPKSEYEAGFVNARKVTKGSVLCTIKRRICQAYPFLTNPAQPLAFNQDIALLRPKPEQSSPVYLAAYLGSSIGQALASREQTEQMNPYLSLIGLGNLPVVLVSPDVQSGIKALFLAGEARQRASRAALAQAETLLLDALGLRGWSPPEPLTYTRSAATVAQAGRLDANYFAPKYDGVIARLEATGVAMRLGNGLASLVSRGSQPEYAETGLPVINSKHVRTNRVLLGDDNRRALPGRVRIIPGDVLINGTGVGTIGRVAPYQNTQDALPDNHVTVVRPLGIDPLYLSVYLNSRIGQMQIERMISGSSGQVELYPADIRNIVVWRAPSELQSQIADKVRTSFDLEARSLALLEAAKRAVEIAIEDSEPTALAFIAAQEVG